MNDKNKILERINDLRRKFVDEIEFFKFDMLCQLSDLYSWVIGDSETEKPYGFDYGEDMRGVLLNETIKSGIVDPLMKARREGRRYCVDFGSVIPMSKIWDIYGDGTWNPPRSYITTIDIATPDNNFEEEERRIYDFLRGKKMRKDMDMTEESERTL